MDSYEPNSARDLINRFISSIGARDETGVVPFVQAWPRIVGEDKAAHSQVLDVKNGTVLVGVDHPAWLQRLHMDRVRTIARIRRDFPSLGARTLAFTIVSELSSSWSGATEAENDGDEPVGSVPPPATSAAPAGGVDEEPGEPPSRAEEDEDFQKRLASLRQALERREAEDSIDT